jgi:heptosyltransferase-1
MPVSLDTLHPARIAIVKPSALGDIVHSLPVLTAVRKRFPAAEICWIVNRSYEILLRGHPHLDSILTIDRHPFRDGISSGISKQRELFRELREKRFDLVIDLQGLLRSGIISRLTGAKVRIGLASAREGSRWFYTHLVDDTVATHAVDRYWKVVEAFGSTPLFKTSHLPVQPDAREWALQKLGSLPRPLVGVAVGSRWLTKRWPPRHFAELTNAAQDRFGGTALFLGTPDERSLAEEAAKHLRGPSAIFAGETSLAQLIALIAASDVVLANDTGPLHIAAALGRPVVAPYTCTSVKKTGPYGQFSRAVETTVWCQGQEVRTCSRMECMAELTPARLWPALEDILSQWQRNLRSA